MSWAKSTEPPLIIEEQTKKQTKSWSLLVVTGSFSVLD